MTKPREQIGHEMIVVVDERVDIGSDYAARFRSLGAAATGMDPAGCRAWLSGLRQGEAETIDAVVVGACPDREVLPRTIRDRSRTAVIAVNEDKALTATLALFDVGYDDVVVPPVHVQEILARIFAIKRRLRGLSPGPGPASGRRLLVHQDGRDPDVDGAPLALTRRERAILACLAANEGRWVSKSEVFNAVYGVMQSDIGEQAVESHVSRLRARLRARLGSDPIRAQRYSGYVIDVK